MVREQHTMQGRIADACSRKAIVRIGAASKHACKEQVLSFVLG
jgi:hypothetical protein